MVGFFTGLIIVGISLIFISFVMVMYDRKRDQEEKDQIISLRDELRELLEDSNEMVNELNRFSDYVVTKVDEKCLEFQNLMDNAPRAAVSNKKEEQSREAPAEAAEEISASTDAGDITVLEESISLSDEISFSEDIQPISSVNENTGNGINPKHAEVIRLFEAGMSDLEIAKALNMGKGEVQLIVGLNLNKIRV